MRAKKGHAYQHTSLWTEITKQLYVRLSLRKAKSELGYVKWADLAKAFGVTRTYIYSVVGKIIMNPAYSDTLGVFKDSQIKKDDLA
jgi:hypothetical protein